MPTARPRHMITETDDMRDAIDAAARYWPEIADNRPALLRRLIQHGAQGVLAADDAAQREWSRTVRETAGIFRGVYPPDAARLLKEEWPE